MSTPRTRSRTDAGDLGLVLRGAGMLLANSALSAGLAEVRGRSLPDRVRREAARFVGLVETALAGREPSIARALDEEARVGAFACAEPREARAVLEVWRRVLDAFAAELAIKGARQRLRRALADLGHRLDVLMPKLAAERLDLVVLGASAGGIEAMRRVLLTLNTDLPATLLLVLHVSPRGPSLLPAVLGRKTRMAIAHAVRGSRLSLGHVYVAPPGSHLVVTPEGLDLVDGPAVHFVKPSIDVLFESAARVRGRRLLSVVLSGTGADGATGTIAVHEQGGVTLVQSPGSAEFGGMITAALATGAVDRQVPLAAMGTMIQRLVTRGRRAIEELA